MIRFSAFNCLICLFPAILWCFVLYSLNKQLEYANQCDDLLTHHNVKFCLIK